MLDELLRSLRAAFSGGPEVPAAWLLFAVIAAMAVALVRVAGAARRRGALLRKLAARHGLGARDLRFARALARRAGVETPALFSRLDVFERATAAAASADADAIRRLRQALGFDRLPPHVPLLSTRELAPGMAVALGAAGDGEVAAVDERSFSVEVARPVPLSVGGTVELGLAHAREARYALQCRLLGVRAAPAGGYRLDFAHDERPVRVQRRAWARVQATGRLELRPLATLVGGRPPPRCSAGLVDVSAGGARVDGPDPLPVGMLSVAAFELGGLRFDTVRAVVLASEPAGPERWQSQLEFVRIPEELRERLVAAVGRASVAARAAAPPPAPPTPTSARR